MPEKLELIRAPGTSHPPDQLLAFQRTNAAPGLRHRKRYFLGKALEAGLGFTLPAGKLQQASKHQFLGRQQVRAPQNLPWDDRAIEELKWIEHLSGLEAET